MQPVFSSIAKLSFLHCETRFDRGIEILVCSSHHYCNQLYIFHNIDRIALRFSSLCSRPSIQVGVCERFLSEERLDQIDSEGSYHPAELLSHQYKYPFTDARS